MRANDQDLINLLRVRQDADLWDNHPIVSARAVLPTGPLSSAIPLVIEQARRQRGCIAFWAQPFTGKSSCVRALEVALAARFPGCGLVMHEAKSNTVVAEGTFIADMLHSIEYQPKIRYGLADKREQVRRALFALGAQRRHVIFMIDEAQELAEPEFRWLKEQGNWLTQKGYRVTVVLFGQQELITVKNELVATGRSDLAGRFFFPLLEFEPIRRSADLAPFMVACDEGSEYPEGTGWSYTRFLWPLAYESGFRLAQHVLPFYQAFARVSPMRKDERGMSMKYVAEALSCLADMTRDRDSAYFAPSLEDWMTAIERAGYSDRDPLVFKLGRTNLKVSRHRQAEDV